MAIFPGYKPKFELNNDLKTLRFKGHNSVHFFGSMLMAFLFGFEYSYGFWTAWEIGDGFKPWWNDPRYKHYNTDIGLKAWLIANGLLSDKFSYQDAFVWNLGGAVIGSVASYLFKMLA